MKQTIICILLIILMFLGAACSYKVDDVSEIPQKENPHLYWKDIEVKVLDVDKKHWFAGTHWYSVEIEVKSDEYDLTDKFEYKGSGAFGKPSQWEYDEGDIVNAELYSWVMDSTGEIIRREIHKIY